MESFARCAHLFQLERIREPKLRFDREEGFVEIRLLAQQSFETSTTDHKFVQADQAHGLPSHHPREPSGRGVARRLIRGQHDVELMRVSSFYFLYQNKENFEFYLAN